MAAVGVDPAFSHFVDQAKNCLNSFYPNWKEIYNASPDQGVETLSIPDALDVLPNRCHYTYRHLGALNQAEERAAGSSKQEIEFKNDSKKRKQVFNRQMTGQKAENEFFQEFRKLSMGGILIAGFDTQEFIKKMSDENIANFNYQEWKHDKKIGHFECDAIFLHHQLGIFVVETKGCSEHQAVKRSNTANEQLNKRIKGLAEIYRRITGKNCDLKIHGVICLPKVDNCVQRNSYKLLTKEIMENSAEFQKFWLPSEEEAQQLSTKEGSNESISDDLDTFIALIIGYRSVKFVSLVSNAMEIHRIIDQQDFLKNKESNKVLRSDWIWMQGDAIILNKEQCSAVECPAKNLMISGPPGTGKTIVLLLRALAAAKEVRRGRVVIFTGRWKNLSALFKKFITANQSMVKRKIEVISSIYEKIDLSRKPDNEDDDYFVDEMDIQSNKHSQDTKYYLSSSGADNHTGSTVIVVTGTWLPRLITDLKDTLQKFPNFHHIVLKTVIRGTESVIKQWRNNFPEYFISLGHNVTGSPVARKIVCNRQQLMETIEGYVNMLLKPRASDEGDVIFTLRHIAVIVSRYNLQGDDITFKDVTQYLRSLGYKCGTAAEQLKSDLIAVEDGINTLSYDWPVVIYVGCDKDAEEQLFVDSRRLIGCSRCISKLFIVDRSIADWINPAIEKLTALP